MNDAQWVETFGIEIDRLNAKLEAKDALVAKLSNEAFEDLVTAEERIAQLERELGDREAELEAYVAQESVSMRTQRAEWTQADEKVFIDASVWMTSADRDKILQRKMGISQS